MMTMRGLKTIIFLLISNTFMTLAWYGHLRFKDFSWGKISACLPSFSSAGDLLFSNICSRCRPTGRDSGRRRTLFPGSAKTIQEAITLTVFVAFTLIFFKEEKLAWNHLVGFGFLVAAVFFIFKKW